MRIATLSKRTAALATVAVLAFGLAACGDDDGGDDSSSNDDPTSAATEETSETPTETPSETSWVDQDPETLLSDIQDSTGSLNSLRVQGMVSENGEETKLNLALNTDGNCEGTVGVQGGTAQLISVDGVDYLKGDEEFWKASAGGDQAQADQIIGLLGDRWAKVPASSGGSGFGEVCDLDNFLADFTSGSGGDYTVGETSEVDGIPAVELVEDNAVTGEKTTAVVGTEDGKHYILALSSEGGDSPGEITFSEFDEPVQAKAPAPGDVLDLDALGG